MNLWEKLLALLIGVPLIALLGGVGVLAFQVGETWQEADTRALISGATTSCAGGAVVLAVVLGLLVGVPLALRAYSAGAYSSKRWDDLQNTPRSYTALPGSHQPQAWLQSPPQVHSNPDEGQWLSNSPYDLIDDDANVIDGDWQ